MAQRFYSHGKLLLSGEYVVLDGALALALPTRFGQDLVVEQNNGGTLQWRSLDQDGSLWFEAEIPLANILQNRPAAEAKTNTLIQILHSAHLLNPDFLVNKKGFDVTTTLEFPRLWGLGSSSTLINNVAQWFGVDAFELLQKGFGGSGYDVACAQHNHSILYQLISGKPTVTAAHFAPKFAQHLYFVYLNQKQDSKQGIANYRALGDQVHRIIPAVNTLTQAIVNAGDFTAFENALKQHEELLSEMLGMEPVQQRLFPDFDGTVKSLGAWGGDFVLVAAKNNPMDYFRRRGFPTVIPYQDMIL